MKSQDTRNDGIDAGVQGVLLKGGVPANGDRRRKSRKREALETFYVVLATMVCIMLMGLLNPGGGHRGGANPQQVLQAQAASKGSPTSSVVGTNSLALMLPGGH